MDSDFARTIEFQLGDNIVELQMSSKMLSDIKSAFGLATEQDINESHVKFYLTSGMKNALEASDENTAS